jgi:hypothetical protein
MRQRALLLAGALAAILALGGCTTGTAGSAGTGGTTGTGACTPTDQDQYVYHPDRLQVVKACIRVTGTVDVVRDEADGDKHILLKLDTQFQNLLQPANQDERGDLVVEPVCVGQVTQADAEATCAADHDPFSGSLPNPGDHVWMEGRYVYDEDHNGWAELHPLYRYGPAT